MAQNKNKSWKKYDYAITLSVTRGVDGSVIPEELRAVSFYKYDTGKDWAILRLEDGDSSPNLVSIPISIDMVEADTDLKIFHAPVGVFNAGGEDGVSVYTDWVKSARMREHCIPCSRGLFPGSSGGPFVTRAGFAVGMHQASVNHVREMQAVYTDDAKANFDALSDSCKSSVSNHASNCSALHLGSCPALVQELRDIGLPL